MAEFKIACYLVNRHGGMRKKTVEGEIVCDGLFGIRVGDAGRYDLTHLGTGRRVAGFSSRRSAKKCAAALSQLLLPWDAKCLAGWKEGSWEIKREARIVILDLGGY